MPSLTSAAHAPFAHDDHILAGYTHLDFPDLSSRRFAEDSLTATSLAISPQYSTDIGASFPAFVAAVGRVLGAYCGSQDVLLAIASDGDKVLPVRVNWSQRQPWREVISSVTAAISDPHWPRTHPNDLRRALNLSQKQSPALALVYTVARIPLWLRKSFPLSVEVDQRSARLWLAVSERLCHPSQSKLFLAQVAALVDHATTNPDAPLSGTADLAPDLLSSLEQLSFEEQCKEYNLVPPVKFATDYLTRRAKEDPEGIAVRWYPDLSTDVPISHYTPETITNVELERKANQLGRWLLQLGLQKGRSVAVCMKRDVLFHATFIGVLRAGGCYVPIEAELPPERQQFILKDSDAQLVLSTADMPCFSVLGGHAIDVSSESVQEAIRKQSDETLMVPELEDLSYLLYTSGTTGTPKGCLLTHKGLSSAIWAISQPCASAELEASGKLNYLSLASVAFDVHLAEILVPMAVGIPILAAPRSLLLEDVPYYIKHLRVSHVGIVPSLIEATMNAVEEGEDSMYLRYVASGGEKMSDAIIDKWASHPKALLANFYGPSEVTIGCASRKMDKDTPRANIGRPFANVGAYVVDPDLSIVLRGGTGELIVEGPLVGRGYVGRPDLTSKVFLNFPPNFPPTSDSDPKKRWAYRTGDLVRMMPDGTLEIIGRIDTQIKLRGVRIESEGISSILRAAAAPTHVLDVLTVLAKHPALGVEQIVSFVAWDPSVPVSTRRGGTPQLARAERVPEGLLKRLREAGERELASYMRPSHIVPLTFIPLSANGKADAKVLSAFFVGLDLEVLTSLMSGSAGSGASSTAAGEDVHAPTETSEQERKVIGVLEKYAKIPVAQLGPKTNLFECGMDSLAVARLAADLRRTFGARVSPSQIMQAPVVHEIAALLELEQGLGSGGQGAVGDPQGADADANGAGAIESFANAVQDEVDVGYARDTVAAALPAFPVQEGVLFRSANNPTMYVQHVLMRLGADVEGARMREAWGEVVRRHEMLRTVFHFGSELVQVVLRAEAVTPQFTEKTIADCDDAGFRQYFTDREAASIARELNTNISQVPPVRLSLFSAGTSRSTYMVLSVHHTLYDGISLPVTLQDLERAYAQQPQLPSAALRDVLAQLSSVSSEKAQAFWSGYLADYPWQRLLNRTASSSTAELVEYPFGVPLKKLQAKAAERHVTLQALLMCAYGSLLGEHLYGHDDVVFGVIRSGRAIPVDDIDTTICPMITVVPARVRLSDPARALLAVQEDNARVSEYEHVPLSRIQKWVPGWEGSLFDTLFSISVKDKEGGKLWKVLESQNPEPDYVLAVEVVLDPEQDKATVHAAFTSSDISSQLVDTIVSHLEEVALHIVESADWTVPRAQGSSTSSLTMFPSSHAHGSPGPQETLKLEDVDPSVVLNICTIAAAFLHVDLGFVKAETSLLSLGLDSIKSVGLSRKFSGEGLRLSSANIMRLSTPVRMAAFMQQSSSSQRREETLSEIEFGRECKRLADAADVESIKLSPEDEVRVFPTSILQAGMLSQTLSSQGRLYVHLFPLRLAKDVDVARLREAWARAFAMYDILRTSFHFLTGLGVWAQAVHSVSSVHWTEAQSSGGEENLVETLNPFLGNADEDDFREPPVFLHLLTSATSGSEEAPRLILVMHHALYDGLSIAKLLHAVEELYRGAELALPSGYHRLLPRLLWQEQTGTSFWANNLRGAHPVPLPKTTPISDEKSSSTPAVHQFSLPIHVTESEVGKACRDAEVTPQCIGQTAFAKLLATMTRSRDVVFGRVVSGRDVPGAEDVIGPMLNTVPCRVVLPSDGLKNRTLLKQVQDANVASMAWQHASLRAIQRELGVASLWDSLFVYQPRQESLDADRGAPWTFDPANLEEISIHYPLNIELHEADDGFVVQAACTSDVADAQGLRELIERYATIVSDLIRHLDEPWQHGLPNVSFTTSLDQGVPVDANKGNAEDWDSRFDTFRDILSTSTKVPLSKIHPGTHLAAIGVDSITAVQIVAKARRAGMRLTAADVVQSKTVGDILGKIKKVQGAAPAANGHTATTTVDISRGVWSTLLPSHLVDLVERVVTASAGMEWLMGMWQRSKGSRFQHVFGYRLPADVDARKLQNAWDRLLRRHAILRSTFVYNTKAEVPYVVVYKAEALKDTWSSQTLNIQEDPLDAIQQRMRDLVSHPPPISYPFTHALFLHSPQAAYLALHLHHFQYDAWSLQLLVDDLSRLYAGQEPRSSNDLEGFLRSTLPNHDAQREQKKYWKAASLDNAMLFPSLTKKPNAGGRSVYTDHAAISGARKLDQSARELSISLQSVFLACWARVQARHSGADAPVFSLWHSGRTGDVEDLERLAVPCINVLPLSVPGAGIADTIDLARQIQEDLQARSAVIEQSRLVKVHEWAGLGDKPVSSVFINVVKIAPDLEQTTGQPPLLESIDVPYWIPPISKDAAEGVANMHITDLTQDDIMVDIVVVEKTDQVVISIEFSDAILDQGIAKSLLGEWAALVKEALNGGKKQDALCCICM